MQRLSGLSVNNSLILKRKLLVLRSLRVSMHIFIWKLAFGIIHCYICGFCSFICLPFHPSQLMLVKNTDQSGRSVWFGFCFLFLALVGKASAEVGGWREGRIVGSGRMFVYYLNSDRIPSEWKESTLIHQPSQFGYLTADWKLYVSECFGAFDSRFLLKWILGIVMISYWISYCFLPRFL